MYLPQFTYVSPSSLEEALDILRENKGQTAPLAGGTDLLVEMKEGNRQPTGLMSLKNIKELHQLKTTDELISIGGAVTISALENLKLGSVNPALTDVIRELANPQIRNRATVAGNLCTAAACADFPPALLINKATVTIAGKQGSREISVKDFITGPRKTSIQCDELVTRISFKRLNSGSAYIKFGLRKALNISIVGVAASIQMNKENIEKINVAVTAASPRPVYLDELSTQFTGSAPDQETWKAVAELVAQSLNPISDLRASAEYRLQLAKVGTVRALQLSYQRWKEFNSA